MTQIVTGICPEIIGREKELAVLRQALNEVRSDHGRFLFLSGEAGIGKSRLVEECKQTALLAKIMVFQGMCFEQDQNFPFSFWIEGIHAILNKPAGGASLGSFQKLIAPFAPNLVKILPEITSFLPDVVPSPALDSEAEKHRLFETWGKLFTRMSQDQPLLIVLEDLHWSDDVSLELLQFLTRRILSQPILLIATYRNDEVTPHLEHILAQFDRQHLVQEIHLGPLSPGDSASIIKRLFQGTPANERMARSSVHDQILFYAQGNPFYIEELLKLQIERAEAPESSLPPIPRSLRDTIHRRTLRLSAGAQKLLTCAAVTGERFRPALLVELTHQSQSNLLQQIHELLAASLLAEMPTGELSFRHALIREAVYASLLVPERHNLHLHTAEAIVRLYSDRLEMMVTELAYHYYMADAWEKALEYGQKAGDRMLNIAATQEALAHFNRAIDAASHLGMQPPWQMLLARGKVYDRLGDSRLARADMLAALEQARVHNDQRGECEALITLGFFISAQDFHQSITHFQQALATARVIGEPALIAATLNRIGNWYANQDRPDEAGPYHREALQIYENLQDRNGIAHTLELTAMQLYFSCNILAGGDACEKALSLFRSLGNREGVFYSLLNSQLNYMFDTDITPLLGLTVLNERGEEALHIAQSMGWRSGEADALHVSSFVARASGNYERALRYERQAVKIQEEISHRTSLARGLMSLGMIYLEVLALDDAIEVLKQALPLSQNAGSPAITITIRGLLALVYIERNEAGELDEAAVILEGVAQSFPARTRHERYCWISRARLALVNGRAQEALQIVNALLESTLYIDTNGPARVPLLALLRGDALAALGEGEEAEKMFSAAREGALLEGRRGILWRTLISQSRLALSQKQWVEVEAAVNQARALLLELAEPITDESIRASFLHRGTARIPNLPESLVHKAAKLAAGGLTGREKEIAGCIAEGYTNRQIAQKLIISERTVERHVSNILLKLDFHARRQIAEWARTHLDRGA